MPNFGGVAVLSPTESGGCSGSDITEPRSPRSPESACSTAEEGAGARMPPWASDPAPPAPPPRRLAAQPVPLRRPNPLVHRRITEYFNHKMKPQNGLKRDASVLANDDTKKKCLPKNGVTHDLEKYISYLSQTLSPKVLMDVEKQTEVASKHPAHSANGLLNTKSEAKKPSCKSKTNGLISFGNSKHINEKVSTSMNGFVEMRHSVSDQFSKEKLPGILNGLLDGKQKNNELKNSVGPSTNGIVKITKLTSNESKRKLATTSSEPSKIRRAPATSAGQTKKKQMHSKLEPKVNGIVSSTTSTRLDSSMNGVTCGSNNLSLNPVTSKTTPNKKETPKKTPQVTRRSNRKSSACIANSKNLTWSKANNLKQVQKQKCANSPQNSPIKSSPADSSNANNLNNIPLKPNIPNGVRQVSMTMNGPLGSLNVPVNNLQNCHPLNIQQPCNGSVTTNNLASFVAVPQNMMLTTLRIPPNGLTAPSIGQQNGISAFNRPNVNVQSPTKLNSQFVFPLMQNLNGTVVQLPNLMTKMPNFMLQQASQLAMQRQDHLQNQQSPQILVNGTLLKLGNTMTSAYPNMNKPTSVTNTIPMLNKTVPGLQTVSVPVHSKPNYAVNFSHPVLMPQPGFIMTSVPNMNVKETWSYTGTNTVSSSQISCSSTIMNHPPTVIANYATQALHSSSIPIAPVKPPDNPIQGTDPPSSTVLESDLFEKTKKKCDIPWLSKTVNNNIFSLDTNKISSRPFAEVGNLSEKLEELAAVKIKDECYFNIDKSIKREDKRQEIRKGYSEELRKVEEVARREETIFTQITVLKDVSSNVQNTVIEANFCGSTTESESGIGTDKSIDSPSDSQTSKECDEDSALSLSISLCSVDIQSQKSPILKQPKTLRFPPKSHLSKPGGNNKRKSSTDTTSTVLLCLWEDCKKEFENDPDLLDHIQNAHVETQAGRENYVCLWSQCKVRGKPSCSRLWLERHALSHGGNKPFKCIVDGCERRFSTQILLERHVNNHFNEGTSSGGSSKKTSESGGKLIRRNGKKLRYRRQPWSARMFDFFDAGTMEGLVWRLMRCTRWRLGGACPLREPRGRHTLTLHAALAATRYNAATHTREALVTYYPPHVLEDEWVPEKDVERIKRVEISQLPVHTKVMLYEQFCSSYKKATSPPPPPRTPARRPLPPAPPLPSRTLPARHCTSSRLLNNLIAKQRRNAEMRNECSATNLPMLYKEEEKEKVEVTGAKKRKLGRRYGGNAFWPSGR
ncbi:uncharacterized protein LOC119629350 isoform X3 [Bombyx mori]|uniref:C2H2-type domain-containing protein n=1 Tax=Bombyx mori TaxID=7091 RepID=A0A8R2R0X4_BOMMO|nr:uncharacterized protein LOC119629350 isoform X3 [Bombyx mori]